MNSIQAKRIILFRKEQNFNAYRMRLDLVAVPKFIIGKKRGNIIIFFRIVWQFSKEQKLNFETNVEYNEIIFR